MPFTAYSLQFICYSQMKNDTDTETDKCIYKTLGGCVTPAGFH